jgi:hypothetical protein
LAYALHDLAVIRGHIHYGNFAYHILNYKSLQRRRANRAFLTVEADREASSPERGGGPVRLSIEHGSVSEELPD